MLVIGLTGGIGSGKSTVASLFAEKGVTIIDTDQLARELTQPKQPALEHIAAQFGLSILLPDGTLDRAQLRKMIFADQKNRRWLEELLHPLIRAEVKKQIECANSPYCIVVIPLLFETSAPHFFIQRILVVDASEKRQITRTKARDNVSESDVFAILTTQVDRAHRISHSDDVIHNDGIMEELQPQIAKLHEFYLSLAEKSLPDSSAKK